MAESKQHGLAGWLTATYKSIKGIKMIGAIYSRLVVLQAMQIAAALLSILTLAACGGAVTESTSMRASATDAPGIQQPAPSASPLEATPATSAATTAPGMPLSGLMAFHWATKERFDRRVHRLVFKMSETSTCTYSVAHSGRTIDSGYQYFDLLQHGNKTDFSTSAQRLSGESFVRTDAFTRTAGAGSNREYSNVNVSRDLPSAGVTTLTLISRNQQPTASSVIPGYSLAVSIRCDRPFEVLNGQVGSEASMLALEELSGRSAGTVIGATAAALMHTVDTFALNSGIYLSLAAENQIGTLRIKHPAGVVDSILELDADFYDLPSGAGRYQIELTRSAAPIDDFMLATYGLEQTLDLQADRLAQSAIKAD